MLGFSYMAVRGTEFPLWFVILILVMVGGAFVFALVSVLRLELSERREERNNSTTEKNEKSYMGKDRLVRILSHYILGRCGEEMHNSFISELKECKPEKFYVEQKRETGVFYMYTQTPFPACNEWIKCICFGHDIVIEAFGEKSKHVTITHYFNHKCQAHFFTFYDENFLPKPNETSFYDGIGRCTLFKPFTDKNTTYNGIERDVCVCYDIAKAQSHNNRML